MPPLPFAALLPRFVWRLFPPVLLLCFCVGARATDGGTKTFRVPAGYAGQTLKQFATQADREIVFSPEVVGAVRTNAVQGELTPRDALEQMLVNTGLVAGQDAKTGAFAVRKGSADPNVARAALAKSSDRPNQATSSDDSATGGGAATDPSAPLKLNQFHVLGSRIRETDAEGPSPVETYDREYINATGAMTLSDFLNSLPQTYGGIGVGRGSAPNDLDLEYGRHSESVILAQPNTGGSPVLFAPAQTGVSGVSLRGLGAASTLVLVDGRRVVSSGVGNSATDSKQSFVDLNSIPLGLIDHVEVTTDGASAIYGADAVAGVINIVLKKNFVGTEVNGTVRMTEHGGGRERQTTVATGFATRKLHGSVALNYYDRSVMYASQRSFSKNMDYSHTIRNHDASGNPVYGHDMRIQFGYPAALQLVATTGTLNGLASPARVALAPAGMTSTPTPAQFIPITTIAPGQTTLTAQGQRVTNVAQYLELVPKAERWGMTSNVNYQFNDRIDGYATLSYADSRSEAHALPAYNNLSAGTVPAAFNPFGQDVQIGMIHYEFGSIWQRVHTTTPNIAAGLRGTLPHDWEWDAAASWQQRDLHQLTRNFNSAALPAALANPDPAKRLNPFIDAIAAGIDRTAIYEAMAVYPKVDSTSKLQAFDVTADGRLFALPGGDVKTAVDGSYDRQMNHNVRTNVTLVAAPVTTVVLEGGARTSYAGGAEVLVPVFGKKNALPLFRRLEVRVAGRYQNEGAAGHSTVPKYSLAWSPVQSILFRGSYSKGFRVPSLTEIQDSIADLGIITLNDPSRGNTPTPINVLGGMNPNLKPETSTNEFYGVVFEPTNAKGLSLKVNYYRTLQHNAIQQLSRTTILNNESFFPDRVTRAPATPADVAAGWPGAVTSVRTSLINFGVVHDESVDFTLEYRLPWEKFGRWRLAGNASRTLKSIRELSPGLTVDESGDTYSAPPWKAQGTLFWSRGPLNLSGTVNYLGGFKSDKAGENFRNVGDPMPAVRKFDVRGGYEFRQGIWRGRGKGVRINIGVSNIFDAKPPFYDEIYGYNAALHSDYVWGRTYEFSLVVPF